MTTTRDSDMYAQLAIASDAVKTEVTKTTTHSFKNETKTWNSNTNTRVS